jgi:hypothetical protein
MRIIIFALLLLSVTSCGDANKIQKNNEPAEVKTLAAYFDKGEKRVGVVLRVVASENRIIPDTVYGIYQVTQVFGKDSVVLKTKTGADSVFQWWKRLDADSVFWDANVSVDSLLKKTK